MSWRFGRESVVLNDDLWLGRFTFLRFAPFFWGVPILRP
jgi:hypothetical protein